eukprot:245201-Chlamydomonas_euryale.AAC.8
MTCLCTKLLGVSSGRPCKCNAHMRTAVPECMCTCTCISGEKAAWRSALPGRPVDVQVRVCGREREAAAAGRSSQGRASSRLEPKCTRTAAAARHRTPGGHELACIVRLDSAYPVSFSQDALPAPAPACAPRAPCLPRWAARAVDVATSTRVPIGSAPGT